MVSNTGVELDDAESRILDYFEGTGTTQSHTKEVAEETGITRHTAAKYLSVLEAKGLLGHESVGNAKVWYPISKEIDVRMLTTDDMDEIIDIVEQVRRADGDATAGDLTNLRTELRTQLADDNRFSLGAETEGQLVGFIVGDQRSWEFGSPEKVGWIRVLGVHHNYRNRGIGRLLGEEILQRFDQADVQRVRTMVGWNESDLLPFFHSLDFGMKEATVLEKAIDSDSKQPEIDANQHTR